MNDLRRLWIALPALALAVLLTLLYVNRGAMEQLAFLRRGQMSAGDLVDQRPEQTAQTLAGLAVSAEEQKFAGEAERLSAHDVDQAFALALRQATLQTKPLKGEAAELAKRVEALRAAVKDDQSRVDTLTGAAKVGRGASSGAASAGATAAPGDDLDVAQAQLALDQDELVDASGDLARESGDKRPEIQQQLSAREVAIKGMAGGGGRMKSAVAAARDFDALRTRAAAWFGQRSRVQLLAQAAAEARTEAVKLAVEHDALEQQAGREQAGHPPDGSQPLAGADQVKLLKRLSSERTAMSLLDDRRATDTELGQVYDRWQAQVWLQHHIVGYLLLESFAWLALIVLLAAIAAAVGRMLIQHVVAEQRRMRTLHTILMLGVEVAALLAIAVVVFGVPQQMPTIVGFATAGITVVFQDFILGFIGWFALMGRNGIRVGDWVEINAVSGEVAEITLFRTVLLETGNWTTKGHPTGRRMGFSNSFALRGQYFNFSTSGQWMWDEVSLNLPANGDAHDVLLRAQAAVERESFADTQQAELEWKRVAQDIGVGQFSAKPTVELCPAAAGVNVTVRFVTRASERFEMRNRISNALMALLQPAELAAASTDAEAQGGHGNGSGPVSPA